MSQKPKEQQTLAAAINDVLRSSRKLVANYSATAIQKPDASPRSQEQSSSVSQSSYKSREKPS